MALYKLLRIEEVLLEASGHATRMARFGPSFGQGDTPGTVLSETRKSAAKDERKAKHIIKDVLIIPVNDCDFSPGGRV